MSAGSIFQVFHSRITDPSAWSDVPDGNFTTGFVTKPQFDKYSNDFSIIYAFVLFSKKQDHPQLQFVVEISFFIQISLLNFMFILILFGYIL